VPVADLRGHLGWHLVVPRIVASKHMAKLKTTRECRMERMTIDEKIAETMRPSSPLERELWLHEREHIRRYGRRKNPPPFPWESEPGGFEAWLKGEPERKRQAREAIEHAAKQRQQTNIERNRDTELGIRLINIGYRELARQYHPDTGGSHKLMARLNRVRDRLRWNV